MHSVNAKSNILSWTHYKTLLQVEDEKAIFEIQKQERNEKIN